MRSGTQRPRRRAMAQINMVPFIDVMLVLLIIFMVTAPMISPSVVDLPSVGSAATQPERVLHVVLDSKNMLQLRLSDVGGNQAVPAATNDDKPIDLDSLVGRVRLLIGNDAQTPVVISADKKVQYEKVVQVMDKLQRAGIARVGLAVQLAP